MTAGLNASSALFFLSLASLSQRARVTACRHLAAAGKYGGLCLRLNPKKIN